MRSTGMRCGASRCSTSVASSAASDILSRRTARSSGCLRSRSSAAGRPRMRPACGPPRSLSPLHVTTSAPSAIASAIVGSDAACMPVINPLPRSATTNRPRSRARDDSSAMEAWPVNPTARKLLWCTLSRTRVADQSRRGNRTSRVLLVAPTSTRRAPPCRMTSGMRKPPPISTSSPRDTITSASAASALNASRIAAAPLLTASDASAPVSVRRSDSTVCVRDPRLPVARSNSTLQ